MDQTISTSTSKRPLYSTLPNSTLNFGDRCTKDLPKWIRMLQILPGTGSSPIKCKLTLINIASMPNFEALSYVWGCPDPAQEIEIDGHRKSVAPNLFAALRRLRLPQKERIVWVDALCINQDDLEERSRQVLLMRDIYSMADRVIVWLGEDEGHAAEAVTLINRVAELFYSELGKTPGDTILSADFDAIKYEPQDFLTPNESRDLPILRPLGFESEWTPVAWFYDLPWFKRLWVVQEVSFRPALMYVGDLEIEWVKVSGASLWLLAKGYALAVPCQYALQINRVGGLMNRGSLAGLIALLRDSSATDARDKVFALLGLLNNSARENTLLQPDYSKSVGDVYLDALHYMIQDGDRRFLDVAIGSTCPKLADLDENFPSWVPRFDLPYPWSFSLHGRAMASGSIPTPAFHTPAEALPIFVEHTDRRILGLKGVKISTVKMVDGSINTDTMEESQIVELWKRTIDWVGDNLTPEELEDAFIHTVTGASNHSKQDKRFFEQTSHFLKRILCGQPYEEDEFGAKLFALFTNHFHKNWDNHVSENRALRDRRINLKEERLDEGIKKALRNVRLYSTRMGNFAFVFTSDNRIGQATKQAQPGDEVCVFHGLPLPFLIRKVGEHYRFLGQCYIHGLMNGEALADLEAGRLKEELIYLR